MTKENSRKEQIYSEKLKEFCRKKGFYKLPKLFFKDEPYQSLSSAAIAL